MIKMLFSDLDGTLLVNGENHSGRVTEENIVAIEELEKSGIRFGIATSRSYEFLRKKMDLVKDFDTVAFNGNLVYCDGHILDCVSFSSEDIENMIDILQVTEDSMSMFITKENDVVFYDFNYPKAQSYITSKKAHHDVRKFIELPLVEHMKDHEYCFMIGVFDNQQEADKARLQMDTYPNVQYTNTSVRTFTITKDSRDKVTGILKIASYYGISEDEIAVIGDSYNDIGMLSYFKESYCMVHAPNEVKECAKYVVNSVAECISIIMNKELSN